MPTDAAIHSFVSAECRDALREIAEKNRRSLSKQIAWVLERFVNAKEDDGA